MIFIKIDYLQLSASALRRHVMTVHTGEVHKVCNICNKGFASKIKQIPAQLY